MTGCADAGCALQVGTCEETGALPAHDVVCDAALSCGEHGRGDCSLIIPISLAHMETYG